MTKQSKTLDNFIMAIHIHMFDFSEQPNYN